jgi:hypothetical protein
MANIAFKLLPYMWATYLFALNNLAIDGILNVACFDVKPKGS